MENIPAQYKNYTIKNFMYSFSLVMLFMFLNLIGIFSFYIGYINLTKYIHDESGNGSSNSNNSTDVKRFQDEAEYLRYISGTNSTPTNQGGKEAYADTTSAIAKSSDIATNPVKADRVSSTNVQTLGIDEPDILKSDGVNLYFSKVGFQYLYESMRFSNPVSNLIDDTYIRPQNEQGSTVSINLLPVDQISKIQELKEGGTLLLDKNILLINSSNNRLIAYDVSNPKEFKKVWEIKLDGREYISQMRLKGGDLYVITSSTLVPASGCIIPMYTLQQANNASKQIEVNCTDLYYPVSNSTNNIKVTVNKINFLNGETKKNISFLTDSNYANLLYMSGENIYIAYQKELNTYKIASDFIASQNLIPNNIKTRIKYLDTLDISNESKLSELGYEIKNFESSLSSNDLLTFTNEMQNAFNKYAQDRAGNMILTDIIKISLDLNIKSVGSVVGTLLNQFAMDEYEGNLRVATTVEPNIYALNYYYSGTDKSKSNIQILDTNLDKIGQTEDIGKGERIYGVRFSKDTGYVVTFRQTDPFYIIDLSNTAAPAVRGELKIPGYSSYLQEIEANKVLGIGMEGNSLKLSLFDTSDKSSPKEISKYILSDYGSEILQDYHAFLLDGKNKTFFIPGYSGGYIFSYSGINLELKKAIARPGIKRAMFVNDKMYLLSDEKLSVVGPDYSIVNELNF